ncbi:MAG: hypothetical protein WKG07_07900 [Hymenobacter sp.]
MGAEAEVRKGLVGVTDNPFLQRLSFVVNASLIKSRVTLRATRPATWWATAARCKGESPTW